MTSQPRDPDAPTGEAGGRDPSRDETADARGGVVERTASLAGGVVEATSSIASGVAGTAASVAGGVAGTAASVAGAVVETAASVAGDVAERTGEIAGGVVDATTHLASHVADVAADVVETTATVAGSAAEKTASVARRTLSDGSAARERRLRAANRTPIPSLFEVHPEARKASLRDLGLRTVPLSAIRGTAVEGATQRGSDFLPLPQLRGRNWQQRWARINRAVGDLAILPPVDLVKFGDGYWVLDGHNRVAAALYNDQVAVDAAVIERRLPGVPSEPPPTNVAASLTGSQELRAAGQGRHSVGAAALARTDVVRRSRAEGGSDGRPDREDTAGDEPRPPAGG